MEVYRRIAEWTHRSRRLLATAAAAVLGLVLGLHIAFGQNGMLSYLRIVLPLDFLQTTFPPLSLYYTYLTKWC